MASFGLNLCNAPHRSPDQIARPTTATFYQLPVRNSSKNINPGVRTNHITGKGEIVPPPAAGAREAFCCGNYHKGSLLARWQCAGIAGKRPEQHPVVACYCPLSAPNPFLLPCTLHKRSLETWVTECDREGLFLITMGIFLSSMVLL